MYRASGLLIAALLSFAGPAHARPYVTIKDDGTIASFSTRTGTVGGLIDDLMTLYDASGAPRPHIISVWTSFNFDGNSFETIPLLLANDAKGIGMESYFGGDGTSASSYPPVEAMLLHNNVLRIADRAAFQRAPADHFADYLFLLELSHKWGPAVKIPGTSPDELIGFLFHWSFWMDAGGSPAGGNLWHDNGDGTFSTVPQTPATVRYSMLDLYLMGLADPSEVAPFGVLENVQVPSGCIDVFTNQPCNAATFPRFEPTPLTVTATRRTLTVDDVISANGPRVPARSGSPSSWTLGLVLLVPQAASDADIAAAQAAFDPIAGTLAPAFAAATRNRGSLQVITSDGADTDGGSDGGSTAAPDGGSAATSPGNPAKRSKGGCGSAGAEPEVGACLVLLALLGERWFRRRSRVRTP